MVRPSAVPLVPFELFQESVRDGPSDPKNKWFVPFETAHLDVPKSWKTRIKKWEFA